MNVYICMCVTVRMDVCIRTVCVCVYETERVFLAYGSLSLEMDWNISHIINH